MQRESRRERAERDARLADENLLVGRLEQLGVQWPVKVHENRTVLVSFTERRGLRIHRGYAYASDRVLGAVITFVSPRHRRSTRKSAEDVVVSFPVENYVRPRQRRKRRARLRPEDRKKLDILSRLHADFNVDHFGGRLAPVQFRISNRMRTRLGELSIDSRAEVAVEIAISRKHLEHDPWDDVRHTILHEMIHQWQAENGMSLDHGPTFRKKAREIGVMPRASRAVDSFRPSS
ncbi:MAG: SprT-like domain-containing protein [Gemmatimonadota bacterium]|nr:MAG: SprT-like domain-containing protein [Gemmatimonadota bacterium]